MTHASEPQEFLELFGKRPGVIKPGLARIQKAWRILGVPGSGTPTVLVAGTNGKGSTSGLLWHMVAASGVKAGFFSSPHLIHFRERISLSNKCVENELLLNVLGDIKRTLPTDLWGELSFFEINTLLALVVFAKEQTEVNVLEVGLGGRLDCTNIIDPIVSVITSIGLDHQEFLGSTTDLVAREKAGIMRSGRPCLWGGEMSSDAISDRTIRDAAHKLNTPLFIAGEDFLVKTPEYFSTFTKEQFSLPTRVQAWPSFLKRNFAMAANAFVALSSSPDISADLQARLSLTNALKRFGHKDLQWPTTLKGRFQHVRVAKKTAPHDSRSMLIDVCHNPHGARFLALALEETSLMPPGVSHPALLSILADKDDGGIWSALKGKISSAFLFKIPSERTWSQESTKIPGPMFDSFGECFAQAWSNDALKEDHQQPWLVCGSVAAVGEVFKFFEADGWTIDPIDR